MHSFWKKLNIFSSQKFIFIRKKFQTFKIFKVFNNIYKNLKDSISRGARRGTGKILTETEKIVENFFYLSEL